jgi:hypothetical protein
VDRTNRLFHGSVTGMTARAFLSHGATTGVSSARADGSAQRHALRMRLPLLIDHRPHVEHCVIPPPYAVGEPLRARTRRWGQNPAYRPACGAAVSAARWGCPAVLPRVEWLGCSAAGRDSRPAALPPVENRSAAGFDSGGLRPLRLVARHRALARPMPAPAPPRRHSPAARTSRSLFAPPPAEDRVGGGVTPPPPTPPDMRATHPAVRQGRRRRKMARNSTKPRWVQ